MTVSLSKGDENVKFLHRSKFTWWARLLFSLVELLDAICGLILWPFSLHTSLALVFASWVGRKRFYKDEDPELKEVMSRAIEDIENTLRGGRLK